MEAPTMIKKAAALQVSTFAVILVVMSQFDHRDAVFTTTSSISRRSTTVRRVVTTREFPPYVFKPASDNYTATMFFLHDFSEHRMWWGPELSSFKNTFMKLVSPQAETLNLTWKGGKPTTAWFDFGGKEKPQLDRINEDLKNSSRYIHELITQEIKSGTRPNRIVVAGIHQGALLALYAALSYPIKLGGIVALSPWHPLPITYNYTLHCASKDIPIYIASVEGNRYTSVEAQHEIVKQLQKDYSNDVTLKMYKGTHTIDDKEFEDVGTFCLNVME